VPSGAEVVDATTVTRNGREYTVVKYRDFQKDISHDITLDSSGNRINELPKYSRTIVDRELVDAISRNPRGVIPVSILLELPEELQQWDDTRTAKVTSSLVEDGEIKYFMDDQEVSRDEILEEVERLQITIEDHEKKVARYLRSAKSDLMQLNAIESDAIRNDPSEDELVLVNLNASRIQEIVNNRLFEVDRIELYEPAEDTIVPGMQSTNIWAHARFGPHQGNNIGIWQTENGCPPNAFLPNYNRVAGNNTPHSRDMATIIRTVSPLAFIQCRGGPIFPTNAQANNANPQIQVVSRSNQAGGSDNNTYQNIDQTWDNRIYNSMLTASQAAGNTGNGTGNVTGPGKSVNAITVGDIDIDANPDVIWWLSGWRNSVVGNEKPEISAPGKGTVLPAPNGPTGGTSAATAHTGGFIANLMDFDGTLIRNPQRTKALMLSGATNSVVGGVTKVGVGGIDYRNTSQDYQTYNFDGPNSNWPQFDLFTDGSTDNVITVTRWLQNNKPNVRATIAWLSRGNFVANNGMLSTDYDLEVFDPNNSYVGGSHSRLNPFESVDFTVNVSGFYQFKIRRFANPDPASRVGLALAVNFDN